MLLLGLLKFSVCTPALASLHGHELVFLGGVAWLLGLFDSQFEGQMTPSARFFSFHEMPRLKFELADVIFAVFGGVLLLVVGLAARSLFRSSSREGRRAVVFLIGWLGLEIAAFFPMTDFPAVRRVLGILTVMTLLLGRHAQHAA